MTEVTTINYYQLKISVRMTPSQVFGLIRDIDSEECTPDVIFMALEPYRCAESFNPHRLEIKRMWEKIPIK